MIGKNIEKKCNFGGQKPPKMNSKIDKKTKRKKEEKKRGPRGVQVKSTDSHSWPPPVIRGDILKKHRLAH